MKLLYTLLFITSLLSSLISCSSRSMQEHFNESASHPNYKPDEVMKVLAIEKGWIIGDLGAGGGYYTYRFAEETGSTGKVYPADINQDYLTNIEKTAKEKGLKNIHIIKSSEEDSNFEENSLDLLFTRNTFHHIDNKNQYMKKLANKIKPTGKIALIDYKSEGSFSPFGHNVTREEILSSLEDTGLEIEKEHTFLDEQFFFILKRK